MLEDSEIPKVFFDVRNDSDALFAHFGIFLQGVEDIQLMESATRRTTSSRKFLSGLAKCIETAVITSSGIDTASWKAAKEKGELLFKAEHGGSYEVFNRRPIPEDIISYCVGDVICLPELRDWFSYEAYRWRDLVNEETKKRVAASLRPEYRPHGQHRAPWTEEQHKFLDQRNYVPPPRDYFDEYWLDDWYDDWDDNDFEDWTRVPWQGPPS
jgi:exonuclease 3'-5' domain-containing protein 1